MEYKTTRLPVFLRYRWLEWASPLIQQEVADSGERKKQNIQLYSRSWFYIHGYRSIERDTYSTGCFSMWTGVGGWWIGLFESRVFIGHHLQRNTEQVLMPVNSIQSEIKSKRTRILSALTVSSFLTSESLCLLATSSCVGECGLLVGAPLTGSSRPLGSSLGLLVA